MASKTCYINDYLKCDFPEFIKKENLISKNKNTGKSLMEDNKFVVSALVRLYSSKGWHKIHLACLNGKMEHLQKLIGKANLSKKTEDGWTTLHLAVFGNHVEVVKFLLENGVDKNVENQGITPMYIASRNGYTDIVQLLDELGADINGSHYRWSPIQSACSHNHFDTVEYLLCRGANIHLRTGEEYVLLHIAAEANNLKMVELLLNKGNMNVNAKDHGGWTALHIAARNSYDEMIKYLIQSGHANVNEIDKDLNTPLHIACHYGNYNITQWLIGEGAMVNLNNSKGWTPLHMACLNSHTMIVKYLLENKANVDSITNDGKTALHIACGNDNLSIVQLLVDNQADINRTTFDGWTPLHLAIYYGHASIVQYLLKKNPSPNLEERTADGLTIVDISQIVNKSEEMTQVLKEFFTDKNMTTSTTTPPSLSKQIIPKSESLLNEIKNKNDKEAIELIESREIGLEYMDANGWTAIHWACYMNNKEIVQRLVNHNVDFQKKTRYGINNSNEFKGKSALEIAEMRGNSEIVSILNEKLHWFINL